MDIFQSLNNQGITIVMVTHEPEVAEAPSANMDSGWPDRYDGHRDQTTST